MVYGEIRFVELISVKFFFDWLFLAKFFIECRPICAEVLTSSRYLKGKSQTPSNYAEKSFIETPFQRKFYVAIKIKIKPRMTKPNCFPISIFFALNFPRILNFFELCCSTQPTFKKQIIIQSILPRFHEYWKAILFFMNYNSDIEKSLISFN